jgi:GT2 family glycosyltransferase
MPDMPMDFPTNRAARVAVVLVNWKGWADSIECVESLLRESDDRFTVFLVDNASPDGSADAIEAYFTGRSDHAPARLAQIDHAAPRLSAEFARFGPTDEPRLVGSTRVVLIESGSNLGFAGGNNVGARWALAQDSVDILWFLNNDTVADAGAVAALIAGFDADASVGMAGGLVRYYHRPDILQGRNGAYLTTRTCEAARFGDGERFDAPFDPVEIASRTDFVMGACLAVTRAFYTQIGPMAEDYFLYFEELDWAERAKGRFKIGFFPSLTVFHKEGGTIGSSGVPKNRSVLSDYYMTRSRMLFLRKHRPDAVPLAVAYTLAKALRRLLRGEPAKIAAQARGLWQGLRAPIAR